MQKWEYAYIYFDINGTAELTYLPATGPKIVGLDKERQGGMFKAADNSGQVKAWITSLGQEGYEMIGVTFQSYQGLIYTYWFKRPVQ